MKRSSARYPVLFTEGSRCPYFDDGRTATLEYIVPGTESMDRYHDLLARGYRRIGHVFYRNVCTGCSACRPLRVEVEKFTVSASQARTVRRCRNIRVEVLREPSVTLEKLLLYERYVCTKHADTGNPGPVDPFSALGALHTGYDRIIEMDYYIGGRLIAVGIVDEADDSLSSNYFYYDTGYLDIRPGVFSMLQEISLAGALGKRYHYLGFCIEENPKMSYKKYFRPNQVLVSGKWTEYLKQ